jgi:hypothetical protein
MTWLPSLMRLRVPRLPTLWLPLFLLWPLILVLLVVLGALVFVLESRAGQRRTSVMACVSGLWQLLCAMRGTSVDVLAAETRVLVSIY